MGEERLKMNYPKLFFDVVKIILYRFLVENYDRVSREIITDFQGLC